MVLATLKGILQQPLYAIRKIHSDRIGMLKKRAIGRRRARWRGWCYAGRGVSGSSSGAVSSSSEKGGEEEAQSDEGEWELEWEYCTANAE